MSKEIVHVRIDSGIRSAVKSIADSSYNGVFTTALESLLGQAIAMRGIDERMRWTMYSAAKNLDHQPTHKEHVELVRSLTDGLHL